MNTTVNILCYKSKTLSNGEHPLMIRVCKEGKKKYLSLGVSINPQHWDFTRNKPKRNCPNKEALEQIIANKSSEYTKQIIELKAENREFTASSLIDKTTNHKKLKTVNDVFLEYIELLLNQKRNGYMLSVKQVYNSLISFNKHLNIYFTDIDISWLKRYETWLRNSNIKENTIGIRFRTLRAIYNIAIESKIVKPEYYPFKSYKVSKLHKETAKRAISKLEIENVINYQSTNAYKQLSVDIFAASFLMGGINFVDLAHLTKENIVEEQLVYYRKKTNKLIKLPIHDKAFELIKKYSINSNEYLFPILSKYHTTEQQKANRIHKVISKVNINLKLIGKELNIATTLTTYVARHSFATILKRSGVSTAIICESLGHSSEKVTQTYLDSFENKQIKDAMSQLI